jgi:hypothetical protein
MRIADRRAERGENVIHGVILAQREIPGDEEGTMRAPRSIAVLLAAGALAFMGFAPAAHAADTKPATGSFTFVTANGILPTWSSDDLVIIGVSPGSALTTVTTLTSTRVLTVRTRVSPRMDPALPPLALEPWEAAPARGEDAGRLAAKRARRFPAAAAPRPRSGSTA